MELGALSKSFGGEIMESDACKWFFQGLLFFYGMCGN